MIRSKLIVYEVVLSELFGMRGEYEGESDVTGDEVQTSQED
jgi:hypothetical protein